MLPWVPPQWNLNPKREETKGDEPEQVPLDVNVVQHVLPHALVMPMFYTFGFETTSTSWPLLMGEK